MALFLPIVGVLVLLGYSIIAGLVSLAARFLTDDDDETAALSWAWPLSVPIALITAFVYFGLWYCIMRPASRLGVWAMKLPVSARKRSLARKAKLPVARIHERDAT